MMRKKAKKLNYSSDMNYSVVQFLDKGSKMFECIWDGWFVDENRESCFWPPSKGKSYMVRVLSQEKPDDSWKIYQCIVISEGHVTYNSGFEVVKEKCAQKYNTSSADDAHASVAYQRKHPVLAAMKAEKFEHLFKKKEVATQQKIKAKSVEKNQGKKSGKGGECLQNATIVSNDISRADVCFSSSRSLSQVSPQRSRSQLSHDLERRICSRQSSISSRSPARISNHSRRSSSTSLKGSRASSQNRSRSTSRKGSRSSSRNRSRSTSRKGSRSSSRNTSRSTSRKESRSRSRSSSGRKSRSDSRNGSYSSYRIRRSPTPSSESQLEAQSSTRHFVQLQLKELRAMVKQNYERISANDRRLARMEVSVNKVLVTITDLKDAIYSKNTLTVAKPKEIPKGFKSPDLPIETMLQLVTLNRNLRDGEFRVFLVSQELYYCSASRQSDTVVMTAYLKRFITLELRDRLHLKDAKGKDEPTLTEHFPEVYKFLIDVMVKGYRKSNTQLKPTDAHVALRTVWGRTKQMLREQKK